MGINREAIIINTRMAMGKVSIITEQYVDSLSNGKDI